MVLELNSENFAKEVLQSDLPVVVDFWASWCGPCQMMIPVFEQLSAEMEGKVKFAKLSTENFPDLAQKYHITGIPCLLVFKNGEEADRIVGFAPKETMKMKIEGIVG